ncbi:MAG: hypothetical protein IT376_16570 [Polyangiaceae bacterium]|nr:hypothetical protein [Polyangiaceae bacterium]
MFELEAEPAGDGRLFGCPYPSDLRPDSDERPRVDAVPNPRVTGIVERLVRGAADARGSPVLPVAHLRFSGALAPHTEGEVVEAGAAAELPLADVDPESAERGRLLPVVSEKAAPVA